MTSTNIIMHNTDLTEETLFKHLIDLMTFIEGNKTDIS